MRDPESADTVSLTRERARTARNAFLFAALAALALRECLHAGGHPRLLLGGLALLAVFVPILALTLTSLLRLPRLTISPHGVEVARMIRPGAWSWSQLASLRLRDNNGFVAFVMDRPGGSGPHDQLVFAPVKGWCVVSDAFIAAMTTAKAKWR